MIEIPQQNAKTEVIYVPGRGQYEIARIGELMMCPDMPTSHALWRRIAPRAVPPHDQYYEVVWVHPEDVIMHMQLYFHRHYMSIAFKNADFKILPYNAFDFQLMRLGK